MDYLANEMTEVQRADGNSSAFKIIQVTIGRDCVKNKIYLQQIPNHDKLINERHKSKASRQSHSSGRDVN